MYVKRQRIEDPAGPASKKQRVNYGAQSFNGNNRRKRANKDTDDEPPLKRIKEHPKPAEPKDDDISSKPVSKNNVEIEAANILLDLKTECVAPALPKCNAAQSAQPVVENSSNIALLVDTTPSINAASPTDTAPSVNTALPTDTTLSVIPMLPASIPLAAETAQPTVIVPDILPDELPNLDHKDADLYRGFRNYFRSEAEVVTLSNPDNAAYQERATPVAGAVCKAMQHFIADASPAKAKLMLEDLVNSDSTRAARLTRATYSAVPDLMAELGHAHAVFSAWTDADISSNGNNNAIHMYAGSFILFIARLILGLHRHSKGEEGRPKPRRVLLPSFAVDTNTVDAQGNFDAALGIVTGNSEAAVDNNMDATEGNDKWYADLFAAVEIRQGSSVNDKHTAAFLLAKRCRAIYRTQPNRRFMWGLTICGSFVRAYLFGSNFVLASDNMNVCTESGRDEVIKLFVNLSYTEDYRLGYDPTFKRLDGLDCWEITVPCNAADGSSTGTSYYYSNMMMEADNHMFGRKMRCFLATMVMPTADQPIHDKHCTAVVHDLWSEFVGKSQTRISDKHIRGERFSNAEIDDEVYNLGLVKKVIGVNNNTPNSYPVIIESGIVRFERRPMCGLSNDTNVGILNPLFDRLGSSGPHITQPCVHRRYVTRLPGSPITEITSVPDLIVAAAGAMGMYHKISWACEIVHRNITPKALRFHRLVDGRVKGMLTNFERSAVKSNGSAAVKDENSKDGGSDLPSSASTTKNAKFVRMLALRYAKADKEVSDKSLFIDMDVDDDMEVDPSLDPSAKENKWLDGDHFVANLNSGRPTSGPTAELEDWASLIDTLIWMGFRGLDHLATGTESEADKQARMDIMGLWNKAHEQSTPYHAMHYFMFSDAFSRLLGGLNKNVPGCGIIEDLLQELRDGLFDYTRRADDFDRPSVPMNEAELSPTQCSQSVDGDNIRSGMCARIVTRLTKILERYAAFFQEFVGQ
ncbi:hypothetical protein LPJ66_003907 [Kickxella alabastrina]|uniref:Uncharacterized protein n=1 Tax=Kickxella alabastrina TaxID=61397 RepID=A0ACC1IMG8_9FUNG|nr:hypothetical protein LPJ66_003907 [Kickxella alabastrina]